MGTSILESIRLIHVRAANMSTEGCPVKAMEEQLQPKTSASEFPETNRFRVIVFHSIHGRRSAEKGVPEVQIDASFELIYSKPQDMKPTSEELQAFADTNALMNCWPYWRELVQTTVARMNLPPLFVPLLRYVPPPPEKKPEQAGQTKQETSGPQAKPE